LDQTKETKKTREKNRNKPKQSQLTSVGDIDFGCCSFSPSLCSHRTAPQPSVSELRSAMHNGSGSGSSALVAQTSVQSGAATKPIVDASVNRAQRVGCAKCDGGMAGPHERAWPCAHRRLASAPLSAPLLPLPLLSAALIESQLDHDERRDATIDSIRTAENGLYTFEVT